MHLIKSSQRDQLPITWMFRTENPDKILNGQNGDEVKDFIDRLVTQTVYGQIPLRLALDWPIYTSSNEAERYANWVGARMPTLHEVRSIHRQIEEENAQKYESSVQANLDLDCGFHSDLNKIKAEDNNRLETT
jgi:hypothetical protein